MKRADIIIGLIILFLCVSIFIFTQKFVGHSYTGYGPDRFPRFLAVVWGFLAILMIVNALREKFFEPEMKITWVGLKRVSIILSTTLATLIFMEYIGFLFSIIIYIFVMLTYLKEKNMVAKIFLSIGIGAGVYLLFHNVLHIPLPEFRLFQF